MHTYNDTSPTGTITSATFVSERPSSTYDKSALTLSVTITLSVFIVITLVGNSLVCFAFYKQPRIRRVSYYPIVSLAVADLLCGALAMPAYIAKKHVTGGWLEGVVCDVFRFTYFFTEYASVLSLTMISIERFMAIRMPVKHRTWLTSRRMTAGLLVSWIDAAAVSILPFFWRKNDGQEPCIYDPTRGWSIMVILTNVFFPFLIMLCCHLYTVSYAIRYSRRKNMLEHKTNEDSCPHFQWQPALERRNAASIKRERDVTRTLGLVVGAFVICWGPSTFYYFIQMVCSHCFQPSFKRVRQIFNAVVKLLTFANSFLNPLIYCWLNRTLRNAFYESVSGKDKVRKKRAKEMSTFPEISAASMSRRAMREKRCENTKSLLDANDSDESYCRISAV